MKASIIKNPFTGCTARDMDYVEVSNFWCDPFKLYDLSVEELYQSRTPIVLEGTRGTGKTMILKYLSYWYQANLSNNSKELMESLKHTGIGIYFRYKYDFCNMLEDIPVELGEKNTIFIGYFQLSLAREFANIFADIQKKCGESFDEMYGEMGELLSVQIENAQEIVSFIISRINQLDELVNEAFYDGDWKKVVNLAKRYTALFYRFINRASQMRLFDGILFVVLLDEYENAAVFQGCINLMIKETDDNIPLSFRVGMRPRGMENNVTLGSGERLQPDRDFLHRVLRFNDSNGYKEFAYKVAEKRLQMVDEYAKNGLTDIKKILGTKENFDLEADEIVSKARMFDLVFDRKKELLPCKDEIVMELSCDETLMQMYNIILLLRDDKNDYRHIGEVCRTYISLKKNGKYKEADEDVKKYKLGYSDKYRMALLYILIKTCPAGNGKVVRKKYYSFNTFVYLSSGAINDFISLCRNTFNYINGNDLIMRLKNGKTIDPEIQTQAAILTSDDQLKKLAMNQYDGKKMYSFVDNMGKLFAYYHEDINLTYPETNQFAFEDQSKIDQDPKLNSYFVELINCGAVIPKNNQQHISIGKKRGEIYWLSRIYAPKYQYSYRTRGGYNHLLNEKTFSYILESSVDPRELTRGVMGKRNQNTEKPLKKKNESVIDGQIRLGI